MTSPGDEHTFLSSHNTDVVFPLSIGQRHVRMNFKFQLQVFSLLPLTPLSHLLLFNIIHLESPAPGYLALWGVQSCFRIRLFQSGIDIDKYK